MSGRVQVDGKFLTLDGSPFRAKGVTYGTFPPRRDGELYPEPDQVRADFRAIAERGLNVVRTYTMPPDDVLIAARELDLRLLVTVHYQDWRYEPIAGQAARRRVLDAGRHAVAQALERCAGREEVLALAVGNEVPSDIVRLHGVSSVEDVLGRLTEDVHAGDPGLLATYCNFPTTEYLQVPGQDLACFNVFLENEERFRSYLRHLLVATGDLPLILSELGLGSELHGGVAQADCLAWQLRAVDECGSAGTTVFSWTDEWSVGGQTVGGWGFGLTDERRQPKPALDVVQAWAQREIRDVRRRWPAVSVVVCAYNAASTISECLDSLQACDYPNLEVIVCDDGSTDGTAEVVRRFPVRLLQLPHVGLGVARNEGLAAARAGVVAFLDADAACHPEWPYHLVLAMQDDGVQGVGGPNLAWPDAGFVERAVSKAPGGPVEVLLSDSRAEHVPGCNMAFYKSALEAIGGFDPVYTAAGDDVDVCWKLLDRGHQIAFAPTAQVLHHRRSSISGYLRQQRAYGRAERLVYARHRHRFNRLGQARWHGFIYGYPRILPHLLRPVIYHGPSAVAPFQSVARHRSEAVTAYLSALLPLAVPVAAAGFLLAAFSPLWLALPALVLLVIAAFGLAVAAAVRPERGETRRLVARALVALLFIAQPLARTWGRLRDGPRGNLPAPTEAWTGDRVAWLANLERELGRLRCAVRSGGSDADWDLRAWVGPLVQCRLTTAVAWHWQPFSRMRFRPRPWTLLPLLAALGLLLARSSLGLAVLGLSLAAAGIEFALLRRLVLRALARTTEGAAGP